MTDIYKDGYSIIRDGKTITLTTDEIRAIKNKIDTADGRCSIDYYIDTIQNDLINSEDRAERIKLLATMNKAIYIAQKDDLCAEIWDKYYDEISYDTGSIEYDVVKDFVANYKF